MTTTAVKEEVKETPMIFTGESVRAILAGTKTQTRRVIKPQPSESWMRSEVTDWSQYYKRNRWGRLEKYLWICHPTENKEITCPYGKPGDRVWVKEAIRYSLEHANFYYCADDQGVGNDRFVSFMESRPDWSSHYRVKPNLNPRFMFRWASRITLEITDIRVQRVQEISEADAIAEGIDTTNLSNDVSAVAGHLVNGSLAIDRFARGWDSINGRRGFSWSTNVWVWAITFKKL